MKIYTRTGDEGATGRIGGQRVTKVSACIRAIGDVDELNSVIGAARASGMPQKLDSHLERIQNELFDLGAELAAPPSLRARHASVSHDTVRAIESSIDTLTADLPPLTQFILPGGTPAAASLHLARSVCRRAERTVLEFHSEEEQRQEVRNYLNRLSDWLFVAARTANHLAQVPDVVWTRRESEEAMT